VFDQVVTNAQASALPPSHSWRLTVEDIFDEIDLFRDILNAGINGRQFGHVLMTARPRISYSMSRGAEQILRGNLNIRREKRHAVIG